MRSRENAFSLRLSEVATAKDGVNDQMQTSHSSRSLSTKK